MIETGNETRRGAASAEALAHSEGALARALEDRTARLPSDIWLWAAFGSMGASLFLHAGGRQHDALFVGQWAAPFMLIGVYNKLVKIAGSDRLDRQMTA